MDITLDETTSGVTLSWAHARKSGVSATYTLQIYTNELGAIMLEDESRNGTMVDGVLAVC
jgi:hypothetical protein